MKILLPLILLLVGIGGGVGAGLALRPAPDAAHTDGEASNAHAEVEADSAAGHAGTEMATAKDDDHGAAKTEYIKINNQFIVPLLTRGSVEAAIVMGLSIEVATGSGEAVYAHEPKLRDVFLQVMFDHANMGGFDGIFTDTARLDTLRTGLVEVAAGVIGPSVKSVLITDFVRQPI